VNFEDTYDLESWDNDFELYEKEDWVGLLKLREKDAKKHPSDLYAQQRFAEALNLNKQYSETLNFITPLYEDNHDVGFGITEIVDALYGLGKTKEDYNWINRPVILTLDSDTVQFCVDILKNRRRAVRITDLYQDLIIQTDYCKFNESELAEFIIRFTDEFEVQLDTDFLMDSKLKLKRK
jgi:hypothetical protein